MFLVILMYGLFASVFTVGKVGLLYTSPLFLVGSRMFFAGLTLLSFVFFFQRKEFVWRPQGMKRLILLALFNIYLTNVLEFWALRYLSSFKTCFFYSLSPFVAAFLSYIMLEEKVTPRKWIGLLIGFIGFLPVLLSQPADAEENLLQFALPYAPEMAILLAVVCSAYGFIVLRQTVTIDGYSVIMANGLSMFLGGMISLLHSLAVDDWSPIPTTNTLYYIETTVVLFLVSNLICYNLYGYLLKKYSATFLSLAGFVTPFFCAFFGWFYLGEEVLPAFYLSAVIVFCGLFLFYSEEIKAEAAEVVT